MPRYVRYKLATLFRGAFGLSVAAGCLEFIGILLILMGHATRLSFEERARQILWILDASAVKFIALEALVQSVFGGFRNHPFLR